MILKNEHLLRALEALSRAYKQVAGKRTELVDDRLALEILDRALADQLHTRHELVGTLESDDLLALDELLQASLGRLFALRATLLFAREQHRAAHHSAQVAFDALHRTLRARLTDEDRYAAHYLHRLLIHPVAASALSAHTVADAYQDLFDFYAEHQHDDRAEDMLFHALELMEPDSPARTRLGQRALSYYQGLQELDERQLQRRGLSRFEVRQAMADLRDLLR
ncbi:hypothetical protein DL240_03140 [Lujinxingia litoralis]|uniref:Uncharacterized protein n=1 Tax=Lujinxingia litoralis TaxID=2211119 RepID=A0A328CC61_9DELT|nr:DUF6483 family protein [Lujinxingia litoralis]RAL25220.1 hypothetical protein DL240_03140 [Lujinxingia litoralis]